MSFLDKFITPAQSSAPMEKQNQPQVQPAAMQQEQENKQNDQTESEPQGLDKFKDLYTIEEGEQENQQQASPWDINPEILDKGVQNLDFTSGLDIQNIQKAFQEQDPSAFVSELNKLSQQLYKANIMASMAAVKNGLPQELNRVKTEIPDVIKQQMLKEQVRDTNPAFTHEAAAPVLEGIQTQLQKKYPNASAKELAQMAKEYLQSFAAELQPKQEESKTPAQQEADSWNAFFK